MNEFLKFFDEKASSFPMHMEIYYSKTMDWCITIEKWGCADEYPKSQSDVDDAVLCKVQDSDMELCFAKAYVALKEWLREFTGGY